MFEKVKLGRASDEVVHQVKEVILSGKLSPGDRLPSERELSERFGLSRMTIRDALRVLESRGLIEIKVGAAGGAFIREPNLDLFQESLHTVIRTNKTSFLELAEARKIIETAVAELAAQRATPADLERLRQTAESGMSTLDGGNLDTRTSLDFHAALARASKNYILDMTVSSFRALFSNALERLLPNEEMASRGVHDHWEIFKAVEAGDSKKARTAMIKHLEYFEKMVRQLHDEPAFEAESPRGVEETPPRSKNKKSSR